MATLRTPQPEPHVARVHQRLQQALERHGRLVYSNSLGAEAVVLTDIIWSHFPKIGMFSIDTGRLHEETYALLERLEQRYGRRLPLVHPDAAALAQLVARQGTHGFYQSLDARLECCRIRKVEPFRRAILGYAAWITGVRREQSPQRAQAQPEEWDGEYGLHKLAPLLDWSEAQVWQYIRERGLPYNALHDRQYPSIGCSPCTRAIQPGESRRAGRWWWEQTDTRECGLHPRIAAVAAGVAAH
jgi:phosphoadenosine phosphosulfate reductase